MCCNYYMVNSEISDSTLQYHIQNARSSHSHCSEKWTLSPQWWILSHVTATATQKASCIPLQQTPHSESQHSNISQAYIEWPKSLQEQMVVYEISRFIWPTRWKKCCYPAKEGMRSTKSYTQTRKYNQAFQKEPNLPTALQIMVLCLKLGLQFESKFPEWELKK